jgi:hypothetical protein
MGQAGSAFGRAEALFYLAELADHVSHADAAEQHRAEAAALLHQLGTPSTGWLNARIALRSSLSPADLADAPDA